MLHDMLPWYHTMVLYHGTSTAAIINNKRKRFFDACAFANQR